MTAELDKMFNRLGDLLFLDVTVRELEDLIDTGVDINAYRGKSNLLLKFSEMFANGAYNTLIDDKISLVEQLIGFLLENGANPNVVSDDKYTCTSLRFVLDGYEKSWKPCRLLVSHGADVNAVYRGYGGPTKKTVIYYAYDSGWSGWGRVNKHMWLRMFIEAGADPMKCIWKRIGSALLEHVFFMTDFVEEVFMLDFYIEN